MAGNVWKIVNILVERPHAQLRKWLRKCVKLSEKTDDRLSTMFVIALGLSQGSCQHSLADQFNMRRIAAKFVPRLLNNDQRDHWVQLCTKLQKAVRNDPNFLSRVITGDESWLYNYDPETNQKSSQWKTPSSPRPKKRAKFAATSSQVWFFFSFEELCIRSLFLPCQTVNGNFYCEVLRRLRENVRRERPEIWQNGDCCTMTVRLHTYRSLWGNSWQKITWPLFPTLPTHMTWPPCDF